MGFIHPNMNQCDHWFCKHLFNASSHLVWHTKSQRRVQQITDINKDRSAPGAPSPHMWANIRDLSLFQRYRSQSFHFRQVLGYFLILLDVSTTSIISDYRWCRAWRDDYWGQRGTGSYPVWRLWKMDGWLCATTICGVWFFWSPLRWQKFGCGDSENGFKRNRSVYES